MRTTLDLPEDLVAEALEVSGANSKTTAICLALQEYIRMKKTKRLLDFRGKIDLDLNTAKIRKERDRG